MKPELIVISHGAFAMEARRSAEMIVGEIQSLHAVAMSMDQGLDEMTAVLSDIISGVPSGTPVIILADIPGGTPCNAALAASKARDNIHIMTGLNLIMLIEYALAVSESAEEIMNVMKASGEGSIAVISAQAAAFRGEIEYDE